MNLEEASYRFQRKTFSRAISKCGLWGKKLDGNYIVRKKCQVDYLFSVAKKDTNEEENLVLNHHLSK